MDPPARSGSRARTLDEGEIRTLWTGLPRSLARSRASQEILKLCLVTGQRVGEIAGMRRGELDLANTTWRISATRTKNGHEHAVPLSPLAIEVIHGALMIGRDEPEFVFPDTNGGSLPAACSAHRLAGA